MVTTHIQADIPLNIEQVFEHISQLENMVEYNSSVKSAKKINPNEDANSSNPKDSLASYEIVVDMGIKKFSGIYRVMEFIPNKKIVASCELSDLKFTDTYTFLEQKEGTHFEITDITELKGFLAMSEFLLGPIMKNQMNQNLKTLLKILENKYS